MSDSTLSNAVSLAPSIELFYEVSAALKASDPDEHFKFVQKMLLSSIELYKKELGAEVKASEQAAREPVKLTLPQNELIALESTVRATSKSVVGLLKRFNLQKKVDDINATHKGTEAVTLAIIEAARKVPDEVLKGLTNLLKKDLDAWIEAKNRVAAGGHPSVSDKLSKVVTHLWVALDNGFDALGMLMRTRGTSFDAIYAKYPQTRNVLRPRLVLEDPAVTAKKAKAASLKKAKTKAEKQAKSKETKGTVKAPANGAVVAVSDAQNTEGDGSEVAAKAARKLKT